MPTMVLDAKCSVLRHRIQNVILILISLAMLPLNSFFMGLCYVSTEVFSHKAFKIRQANQKARDFRTKIVLVTGVGMTKGLTLARVFYLAGHTVIGADFEPNDAPSPGRWSRALAKFYELKRPSSEPQRYIKKLIQIVKEEKVDLWISCSGVASAVEDAHAKESIESQTRCRAIQFGARITETLHEKHLFIEYIAKEVGLGVPETHTITSKAAVEQVLENRPYGRRYIMKTVGVVDAVRADMTLLPKATEAETMAHINNLPISTEIPWILQEFIEGKEYCTHALIIGGEVKSFVACPSAELLMHYEALPRHDPLSEAMLTFTIAVAKAGGSRFNGHLSFDFMVPDRVGMHLRTAGGESGPGLFPIECNPRAHTAVVLYNSQTELADAYLSILNPTNKREQAEGQHSNIVLVNREEKYYWLGHDLFTLLIIPTISLLLLRTGVSAVLAAYCEFLTHLVTWKDGTFELWDPLPFWVLYQAYWPLQFLGSVIDGKKWSRINVSTLKMFEC